MTDVASSGRSAVSQPDLAPRLFSLAVIVAVAGSLLVPRAIALLLGLLTAAGLGLRLWQTTGDRRTAATQWNALLACGPLMASLTAFIGYCAVNPMWSLTPLSSLAKVGWLGLVVAAAGLLIGLWQRQPEGYARLLAQAFLIGFAIGGLWVMIEVVTHSGLERWLRNHIAAWRPRASTKHILVEDGHVTVIGSYLMNRAVAVLNLLMWPALLLIATWPAANRVRLLTGGTVLLMVAAATFPSQHESSQIAFILSALILLASRYVPRIGKPLVAAGWSAAVLLVVPAALLAHQAGLAHIRALPQSAQARIVLWNYTAHEVLKHPIRGVGVDSTKAIDDTMGEHEPPKPDEPYGQRPGQHSHNIYMQTWFELGAIGAALLLLCGLMLWRAILRLPPAAVPFALATYTVAMVIGAFTWGLWQEWYLALFGLTAATTGLAARCAGEAA
jgi:O-Antigen ligase